MNVQNIQGSNVAIGGSSVAESAATYTSNEDLAAALKAIKPLVQEVAENQREAVEAALHVLVEAAEKNIPVAQVAPAASTVANASPTLKSRLLDFAGRAASSAAGSAVVLAIKQALQIP